MWRLVFLLCFLESFGVQGHRWIIDVFTSNIKDAGTDSGIYITLRGKYGRSSPIYLDTEKDNFERGSKDRFYVETPDIGEVCAIVIHSDGLWPAPAWHLEKIWVLGESKKLRNFSCDCWFSRDSKFRRLLFADWPCKRK